MEKTVKTIDGTNLLLGRMCAKIAKLALESDGTINVVNCEKVVISGNKKSILERYRHRRERTDPFKGPYFPKKPDMIVKRCIRGMLPYKQPRGLAALKRIRCYEGAPEELQGKKMELLDDCNIKNTTIIRYISVNDISKELGR